METPPLLTPKDDEHLRLLALGHRIHGGLVCLCSSFFLGHVGVGIAGLIHPRTFGTDSFMNAFGPLMFLFMGGAVVLGGWTIGVLNWIAAKRIEQRRGASFLLIVSVLDIVLTQPLGAVLGVFSIVVMARPQVKAAFGARW